MTSVADRPRASSSLLAGPDTGRPTRGRPPLVTPARVTMLLAVVICAVSLTQIRDARHTTYGLLFSTVPGVPLAIGLATLAFVLALRAPSVTDRVLAVAVSIACLRLPTALGADEPIYGWTYKHLGVIDYIQRHGTVAHGVDIYAGWPGAFSALAWASTVTGLSPITIAQWFAVGVEAFVVVAVYGLARGLGSGRRTALVAAFVAQALGWVGQDYLSPQAVGYVLALGVLVLLVHSRRRPVLGWLALLPFAGIVVSHQLTPYWLIIATVGLGVLKLIRPRGVGLLFATIAGIWLLWHQGDLGSSSLFSGVDPLANAQTSTSGTGSAGQTVTSSAARGTALGLWAVSAVVLLRVVLARRATRATPLWRARRARVVAAGVLAFTPFALLAGQDYGGEALFRVYLYSVPGCAVLIAPLVTRLLTRPAEGSRGRAAVSVATVAVVAASLVSAQAYYGGWFANVVQAQAVRTGSDLLRTMPVPSMLISPVPVGPGRMVAEYAAQARADPLYDASMTTWAGWLGTDFSDPATESDLTHDLGGQTRPVYLLITEQMRDYSDLYGLYPDGALDRFVDQVSGDDRWVELVDQGGVHLWALESTIP